MLKAIPKGLLQGLLCRNAALQTQGFEAWVL